MKKTICLMTNWYPTADNPYYGLFFKEQAFAVAEDFDFIVVHYREHRGITGRKTATVREINREKNTAEYYVDVRVPVCLILRDAWYSFRLTHSGPAPVEGIGKYVWPKRADYTRKRLAEVFRRHFAGKVDAFYCIDAQTEAFYIRCAAEALGKPYVVGEHAPVPWPGTLISDVNKTAIEQADAFLAISRDKIRQLMLQNIRLPETAYIGNLIDEEKFRPGREPHDPKTLIIVAAHSFYKNYDLFIEIMNRLAERAKMPFRVLIVGYGSNKGYSKGIQEFEEQIRRSAFAAQAELIPSVPHDEIGTVLNRADAFVMTSIQEGQPVSALEAACCGLPVFSTRCGGVEDYIDETCGRIYDLTDAEGFAEGLKAFLEGRITFDSERIRQQVVSRFGKAAFRKTFKDVFG